MRTAHEQLWRCLRGHTNEADVRRCDVCRLPRWLTWYALAGAGAALVLGGIVGLMSLSHLLKAWQYKRAVHTFVQDDGQISAEARRELDKLRTYPGISHERAMRLEKEVAGTSSEVCCQPSTPSKSLAEELQRIQEALEQGRWSEAQQAMTALEARYPQQAEVRHLKEELAQEVKGRMIVALLGHTSGEQTLDGREVMVILTGRETGFRLSIEPHEPMYVYLYALDRSGQLQMLFPTAPGQNGASNPLQAGKTYALPAADPERKWYLLQDKARVIQKLYMVTSRWPARDLERWGAALAAGGVEASRALLQALHARQQAHVAWCDVRTLQFAGEVMHEP